MKSGPTLIDTLYRLSYSKQRNPGWTDNAKWRAALRSAKKFVLDDEMSTFLGELGTQAFITHPTDDVLGGHRDGYSLNLRNKKVEHLRMGARLPSEITWIEYNLRKCQVRSHELLGRPIDPLQMPEREGWLLMRHPMLPTAFRAHIISHDSAVNHGDGFDTWVFPVALGWTADEETVLPWKCLPFSETSAAPSEISTGMMGYKTERCGFVFSDMLVTPNRPKAVSELLSEWSGVQRRMWALLATINDLPVQVTEVRAQRGFVARGEYRKFLDHRTVTLTVPVKHYTKVIRTALAMAHRRGGPVREHWRKDFRRPLSPLCEHDWGADEKHMFCTLCRGRKIWVNEHVRGDTSKGFVTHDYNVTHEAD